MNTTVTTLLREFPKVRRAAMRGERVVVKTRAGNLILTRETNPETPLFGCLSDMATDNGIEANEFAIAVRAWKLQK